MSGRSALYSRAISLMARTAPTSPSPRRRHAIGRKDEAFLADLFAMCAHSGHDDNFEAGISCGPRYRETMRAEVPILGDQKEELRPARRVRCGRRR